MGQLIMDEDEIQMEEAPHPRCPRRARPQPVDPLRGHPYPEFTEGTLAFRFCRKLRRMHIRAHVVIDWDAIDCVSLYLSIRRGIIFLS
ncbi:hypothetical protein Hdeb2414_s0028g00700681 [Helianthus debilis subsp. tardiflorus]